MGALQEKAVKDASSKAFAKMPDLKEALKEVTVLKGVGPATASALLAAHSPDVAPFMSDEVSFKARERCASFVLHPRTCQTRIQCSRGLLP